MSSQTSSRPSPASRSPEADRSITARLRRGWRLSVGFCALVGSCAAPQPVANRSASPLRPTPIEYQVGPSLQFATLYAPPAAPPESPPAAAVATATTTEAVPPARRPAVVLLHGGFYGDDDTTDRTAKELAHNGVIAAFPAYRGEPRGIDGARGAGRIEFCEGEVRDALTLVRLLRARSDVDPARVAVFGFSHGGCIGLRMLIEDPQLRGGVLFSPLSDARGAVEHMDQNPLQMAGFAGFLGARLRAYVTRDPRPREAAWAARSPVLAADSLRQPLVILHGTADPLIPVAQTCRLRDVLARSGHPITERLFSREGVPIPSPAQSPPPPSGSQDSSAASGKQPAPPLPCGPLPAELPSAPATAPDTATDPAPATAPAGPAEFWYLVDQGHLLSQPAKRRAEAMAVQALLSLLR
jgi:dienelactone hydrolase